MGDLTDSDLVGEDVTGDPDPPLSTSGGGGASTPPDEGVSPRERCRRVGLDIKRTKHVSRATDIRGRDHTLYIVDGEIGPFDAGRVTDVAVMGAPNSDARVRIPADDRGYDVLVRGSGFLFANIDLDQRAPGAWGRVRAPGRGMTVRDVRTIGPGRPRNPDPTSPIGGKSGPGWSLPATAAGATNKLVNVTDVHGGEFAARHFGDRPSGTWMGRSHKGTLRVIDSRIEEYGNNAIYATAAPGRVEAERSRLWNNGVTAGGRFSHGHWKDCDIGFDFKNTELLNPAPQNHGLVGIAAEQKKAGANGQPGPDVERCSIHMKNVASGGSALRAYDIYRPARWGTIEDTDIHIERGAGNRAADIEVRGPVEAIRDCELSGSNDQFVSVLNTSGQRVAMDGCQRDYPSGRRRHKGDEVVWS